MNAMWVETFPHRELVNLATARAIYVDERDQRWFVAADLAGSHRTLIDGLESRGCALEILRGLADQVIRLLAPVVRVEQVLHLSSTTPADRARSRAGAKPGGSGKRASGHATAGSEVSANGNGKVTNSQRMVSAAPIVQLLGSSRRSVRAIAREAEAVVGASPKAMERLIHRLRRGEQTQVRLEVADRLAIALGQDAASIWPGEW